MGYDFISFTTDYGTADGFVAACEGVIATISPTSKVLHVSHTIPAHDIRRGAAVLAQTVPYLPPAVHLAVVDPGVGTERRPLLLVTRAGLLVGPDNGLLPPAADKLGGITAAYELGAEAFRLPTVSATFHGRDLFAPAAAHLARGADPVEFGPALDIATVVRIPHPQTTIEPGKVITEVIGADGFGNLQLAATSADLAEAGSHLGAAVHAHIGSRSVQVEVGRTFGDVPVGSVVLLVDSADHLAIAVNSGSAAQFLGARSGDRAILLIAAER